MPWLIPLVLLGAWLRCAQVHESLWLDELHTSWVVADGAGAVADRARAGNQSPLYFGLVWGVVQLLGHHEWTLRLISLAAGIGLILGTYALVWHWSRSVASGLFAALLVAISRDCIFYAQEARPYALLQLSAVAHAALFVELVQRPTRARRMVLVVGAAWLFYLHYTSFLFLLAEAVCLEAGRRAPEREQLLHPGRRRRRRDPQRDPGSAVRSRRAARQHPGGVRREQLGRQLAGR